MKIQMTVMIGAIALVGSHCYGDLVVNGNFATGDFTGWNETGGYTGVTSNFQYSPPSGSAYFVYFGAVGADASLSQTINTVAGDYYTFSYLAGGDGSSPSDLNAYWNGILIDTLSPVPNQNWTQYSFTEQATSAHTVIDFGLRNDPSYDCLGNISVNEIGAAVPEPSTLISGALVLLPFGAGAVRQLRKKLNIA